MTLNRFKSKHISLLYVVLFMFFLLPISTSEGLSVNYLFAFFPFIYLFLTRSSLKNPTVIFKVLIFLAVFIFSLAFFYQDYFYEYADRKLISFLLFMLFFVYCFIEYRNSLFQSFKYAVVLFSVVFTMYLFYKLYLFQAGYGENLDLKDFVGTQRIGFIFVFAFWITWSLFKEELGLGKYIFILFALIILSGVFLTLSRSSIVAFYFSLLIFLLDSISIRKITITKIIIFLKWLLLIFVALMFFYSLIESVVDRYIFLFFEHDMVAEVQNPDASAGVRFVIWSKILEFVANNPLTGSGFLGVWAIFTSGSSHNQYMDILLRTGVFYFFIFMFVLTKLSFLLYRYERYMFYGFMGFIIYGVFHETFKESQGAFILAVLFGWMANNIREKNRNYRRLNE